LLAVSTTDGEQLAHLVGETALVEGPDVEAPGTVTSVTDGALIVSCDQPVWSGPEPRPVTISVFANAALYRLTGKAQADGNDVIGDAALAVERIQRRRWPRKRMDLPVILCPVEEGSRLEGVPGRTVDISLGGVCVETIRAVEGEGDPMIILNIPGGGAIVSGATTVAVDQLEDGWRYRLAFRDLDPEDIDRLAALLAA
jgi:hypothetical protein